MLQPARLSSGITSWVKLGAADALPAAASQMAVVVKRGSAEDFMRGGILRRKERLRGAEAFR
jgi:hypothetical protein